MFYKFLKFLFLSTLTLVWGGCDTKDDPVAGYGCFPTKCYNTTATNDAGKVFDIIECEDGEKFLRHPGLYGEDPELQKELPEGVETVAPPADVDGCGATNCKYDSVQTCIDGKACYPAITCPEK